jgi:hypothetical protein
MEIAQLSRNEKAIATRLSRLSRERRAALLAAADNKSALREAIIAEQAARVAAAQDRAREQEQIASESENEARLAFVEAACAPDWITRKRAERTYRAKALLARRAKSTAGLARLVARRLSEHAARRDQSELERAEKLAAMRVQLAAERAAAKRARKLENGRVRLSAGQMRAAIQGLTVPTSYARVARIGQALLRCWDSAITDQQLLAEIAYITGESRQRPATWREYG